MLASAPALKATSQRAAIFCEPDQVEVLHFFRREDSIVLILS